MNLVKPRDLIIPHFHTENPNVLAGKEIRHWDDSQDAVVFAPHIRATVISEEVRRELSPEQIEILRRGVSGGAFPTASGIYTAIQLDVYDATQLAFAYLADTIKMALYNNSIAATSYYTDTVQTAAPYNANEASGTGYTAGGYTLANKTLTQSPNGTVMFDNTTDPNWTITGSFAAAIFGAVVFDTTISSSLFCAIYFGSGSGYNVTNGTFTVQLNSLGMVTILFAA
jgi:hypothetical protein